MPSAKRSGFKPSSQASSLRSGALLRIQFDANQEYQSDAVSAVVDLFIGLDEAQSTSSLAGDEIIGNLAPSLTLDPAWLLSNLQDVQERGMLERSPGLAIDSSQEVEGVSNDTWEYPSFTIEMETGTGKTYVYIRTLHELRKKYGFRKFVVVVPSVAIYEGVAKTFDITRSHFASLYGNEPMHLIRYEGSQLSSLREFATSPFCEILLITLDSFNKSSNIIFRASEKLPGERLPFQFVQQTRPILIMDEPQNMESMLARAALATLHPLFALRYSATHKSSPNVVYRLTPFDAFRKNLVKRIQVHGVTELQDANQPFLRVEKIMRANGLRAKISTYVYESGRTREKEVLLKDGDDLYTKTKREEHRGGYTVVEINLGERWLQFENGLRVRQGEDLGYDKPEVFRVQIRETIRRHMETQEYLRDKGIKVLSLFFIDRVANYTDDGGMIRKIFDKEFKALRGSYAGFDTLEPSEVREAYFASRKKPKSEEYEAVDIVTSDERQKKEDREAAKRAFELIMRDKERLLSLDEPKSFIFAHSALKEGWDNPNVFQICTLNQTNSETKKRQEIGRGLRLCVDQRGERVFGDDINVLTVIANQSYQSYAEQLQQEYREEGQERSAPPNPSNAQRGVAKRNNALYGTHPGFADMWKRLSQRLTYDIRFDTETLVARCISRLNSTAFPEPKVVVQRGDYVMYHYTLSLLESSRGRAKITVKMENTSGTDWTTTRTYEDRADLERLHDDPRLRGFKIMKVAETPAPAVLFENDVTLHGERPYEFSSTAGQKILGQQISKAEARHPVFNVIDRAQKESRLTRATLLRIFQGLSQAVHKKLFANPEGWAGEFVAVIRDVASDLLAESLVFRTDAIEDYQLDSLFPPTKTFAQKELRNAGGNSLYDLVQCDSGIEERFIEILRSDRNVEIYFKFPPAFRVALPKVVGNYNPDWGILRKEEGGAFLIQLIRETKGAEEIKALRFSHEKRKIVCAKKYFETAGMDYRVIMDTTPEWWKSVNSLDVQLDTQPESQ